jgi:hypothetical protein
MRLSAPLRLWMFIQRNVIPNNGPYVVIIFIIVTVGEIKCHAWISILLLCRCFSGFLLLPLATALSRRCRLFLLGRSLLGSF